MTKQTIYVTEQGKARLLQAYDTYVASLPVDFQREFVQTRFGTTHVLQAGPEDGKPLFILQGGNCINPMTLSWFSSLLKQYRIYSPDTLGHPGYSAETRISVKDNSFSLWITDIMEHYEIEQAAFAGPSYGGGVILHVASHFPQKISCAILFAPAGLILGSKLAMIQNILLPLLAYKMTGADRHMQKIAHAMSDGHMKEIDAAITGEIFRSVKLERDMPSLVQAAALQQYTAPTMVIGGEKDIFFPGEQLLARAKAVVPNVTTGKQYSMGHFASEEILLQINEDMQEFLATYY